MEVQQDFKELLQLFNAHNVDYAIVGGYALAFHGAPRYTGDLDLLIKPDQENAQKVLNALKDFGFARGTYGARIDDGFELEDCMVTNAVRCAPPENKPTAAEINQCRGYLRARISGLPRLKVILALGRIAHDQTLKTLGLPKSACVFGHGARHEMPEGVVLFDSYHCSRYNTNTGRLTEAMFRDVFEAIRNELG